MAASKRPKKKPQREVVLQPHQLRPLKVILNRPQQKGIIAYHSMGSGKTMTAIVFAKNAGRPIVLVSPGYLHTTWKDEIKRLDKTLLKQITFHDVNEIETVSKRVKLAGKLLIVDEAQHLVMKLRAMPADKALTCMQWLRSAYRNILLTGTPIYEDEASLMWLVNIASTVDVVPYRQSEIKQQFSTAKFLRSALNGWIFPVTISNWYLIVLQYMAVHRPMVEATVNSQINVTKGIQRLENKAPPPQPAAPVTEADWIARLKEKFRPSTMDEIKDPDIKKIGGLQQGFVRFMRPLTDLVFSTLFADKSYNVVSNGETIDKLEKWLTDNTTTTTPRVIPENEDPTVTELHRKLTEYKNIMSRVVNTQIKQDAVTRLATLSFTLGLIYGIFRIFYDTSDVSDVSEMDAQKVAEVVLPYISFFDSEKEGGPAAALNVNYPRKEFEAVSVAYTRKQMEMWIDYTYGRLTSEALSNDLKAFETVEEARIRGDDVYTPDVFQKLGLCIGNLPLSEPFSPKFDHILEKMTISDNDPASLKRYKKVRTFRGRTLWPSVVYSQFWKNGILLFSDFLKKNGVPHGILVPTMSDTQKRKTIQAFQKGKIATILLHPEVTEGVNIRGGQMVILMEPVQLKAKRDQVIARPVRYMSLNHLPLEERFVRVVEFYCSVKKPGIWLHSVAYTLRRWLQWSPEVVYARRYHLFDQARTPDELVKRRQDELTKFQDLLTNELNSYDLGRNLEMNPGKDKCCIWNPEDPTACSEKDVACSTIL